MKTEMLEIVNENDEVIGLESRKVIHQKGLLHREIHVWFITPDRKLILQHRAKDKDSYPDKLDAAVGGHVEPGMSYEETAMKEAKEETGVTLDPAKLHFIKKLRKQAFEQKTGVNNNTLRAQYAYLYDGDIKDLRVEEGKAIGFEAWDIDSLSSLSEADRDRFIPTVLEKDRLDMFEEAQKMLGLL